MDEQDIYDDAQYACDIAFEYQEALVGVRERLKHLRRVFPGYSFKQVEAIEKRNRVLYLMWGEVGLILSGQQSPQPKDYPDMGDEWGIYE